MELCREPRPIIRPTVFAGCEFCMHCQDNKTLCIALVHIIPDAVSTIIMKEHKISG